LLRIELSIGSARSRWQQFGTTPLLGPALFWFDWPLFLCRSNHTTSILPALMTVSLLLLSAVSIFLTSNKVHPYYEPLVETVMGNSTVLLILLSRTTTLINGKMDYDCTLVTTKPLCQHAVFLSSGSQPGKDHLLRWSTRVGWPPVLYY